MARFPYLMASLVFCCHCARGLVTQDPQAIAQSAVDGAELDGVERDIQQSTCNVPASGFRNSTTPTPALSFTPEPPPEGLYIDFRYTPGGIMSKYDVWTAITEAITATALFPWNGQLSRALTIPVTPSVEVRFVSSVNPPRYQSKTIIWTLAEAFEYYNTQRHYGNCFLRTFMGRGEGGMNLGVASIRSTLSMNESVRGEVNGTTLELDSERLKLGSGNRSLISPTDDSTSPSDTQTLPTLQAATPGLSLWLQYLSPTATFNDKGFYTLIMNTLVFAAQHDPKDGPCGLVRSYNSFENYTFVVGPTSDAAAHKLPWRLAIAAMGFLPTEMLKRGREGRWAELMGRIKLDGAWIGKILVLKGDHRTDGEDECGVVLFGDGVDME